MFVEQKKQQIVMLMNMLKPGKKEKFAQFLASQFTDEDLLEMTASTADKLLAFLAKI